MIYVGDIGVEIIYYCVDEDGNGEDISAATVLRLKYRKPDKTTGYWTAVLEGTQGLKFTTTLATDLSKAGRYQIQPYLELPGFKGHAETRQIQVYTPVE